MDLLSGVTSSRLSCDLALAILGPRFEMIQLSTVHIHLFTKLKRIRGRLEMKEMKKR